MNLGKQIDFLSNFRGIIRKKTKSSLSMVIAGRLPQTDRVSDPIFTEVHLHRYQNWKSH